MANTLTELAHAFTCVVSLSLVLFVSPAVLMEDIVEAELPDTPATASQENPLQVSITFCACTC